MVLFPVCQKGESMGEARQRVWRGVVRDPLLYFGLLCTLFFLLQAINGPRMLTYYSFENYWGYDLPPVPWLPSGVALDESAQLLTWFTPAIVAALAVRHAMDAKRRRIMLRLVVWNAAFLSLLGVIHVYFGWKKIYGVIDIKTQFFSVFGYPNHAGAFFTFALVLAMGFWLNERELLTPWADLLLVAVMIIFAATIMCLSRTSILMGLGVIVFGGLYAFRRVWSSLTLGNRIIVPFISLFFVTLSWVAMFGNYPGNPVRRELATLSVEEVFGQVWNRAFEMLVPSAIAIWRDNQWYGVGGWGFRHFVPLYLNTEQHNKLFVGAANVHNDFFNFLAEHGTIGLTLLILVGLALVVPLWRSLPSQNMSTAANRVLRGFTMVALLLLLCHSAIDLPFRCPAIIQMTFITLAAVGGLCRDAGTQMPALIGKMPIERHL